MRKIRMVLMVVPLLMAGGCAFFSPGSKPSLLAGDADLSLFQNRTSKNVSKVADATNCTNGGSATDAPEGGGTVTIDPNSITGLVKAVSAINVISPMMAPAPVVQNVFVPQKAVKPVVHKTYTVKNGDNLWTIANANGVTVAALKKANGLKSSVIHPGQKLRLPVR